jgi:hypothetical protein
MLDLWNSPQNHYAQKNVWNGLQHHFIIIQLSGRDLPPSEVFPIDSEGSDFEYRRLQESILWFVA